MLWILVFSRKTKPVGIFLNQRRQWLTRCVQLSRRPGTLRTLNPTITNCGSRTRMDDSFVAFIFPHRLGRRAVPRSVQARRKFWFYPEISGSSMVVRLRYVTSTASQIRQTRNKSLERTREG